jgi:hypothetical protein
VGDPLGSAQGENRLGVKNMFRFGAAILGAVFVTRLIGITAAPAPSVDDCTRAPVDHGASLAIGRETGSTSDPFAWCERNWLVEKHDYPAPGAVDHARLSLEAARFPACRTDGEGHCRCAYRVVDRRTLVLWGPVSVNAVALEHMAQQPVLKVETPPEGTIEVSYHSVHRNTMSKLRRAAARCFTAPTWRGAILLDSFQVKIFGRNLWGLHLFDMGGVADVEAWGGRGCEVRNETNEVIGQQVLSNVWDEFRPGLKTLYSTPVARSGRSCRTRFSRST